MRCACYLCSLVGLKSIPPTALAQVKLIDAGFIWTEPHSRRLKLKLTIQKEVMNGAILQQTFVVDVRFPVCALGPLTVCGEATLGSQDVPEECFSPALLAQFVVEPHMCDQCQRSNTNSEVWIACVQVGCLG